MQTLNTARSATCKHNAVQQQPRAAPVAQRQQQQQQPSSRQQQQHAVCRANAAPSTAAVTAAAAAAAVVLQSCAVAAAPPPAAAAAALPSFHQQQQQQSQWRPVLGELAAWGAAPSAEAPALADAQDEQQEQDEDLQAIEDDLMSQVAVPQELTDFMQMMQQGLTPKSSDKLSAARKAVGFDRTLDGRVLLISDDGEPFQVKPDMGVPGALLLRDAGGYMYYIPSTEADSLVQIDLSDDAIVAQLFANHAWEELLEPLEVVTPVSESAQSSKQSQQQQQQPQEHLEQLRLSERDFRSVLSLLRDSMQLPEEPLEDLDAQELAGQQ